MGALFFRYSFLITDLLGVCEGCSSSDLKNEIFLRSMSVSSRVQPYCICFIMDQQLIDPISLPLLMLQFCVIILFRTRKYLIPKRIISLHQELKNPEVRFVVFIHTSSIKRYCLESSINVTLPDFALEVMNSNTALKSHHSVLSITV